VAGGKKALDATIRRPCALAVSEEETMTTALVQFQRPSVRDKLEATVGRVKSVTELLDDIGAALGKIEGSRELAKVLVDVLPWVADVGEAADHALRCIL
jgi:hypothetical protein